MYKRQVVTFEVGGEPLPVKAYFGLEVKAVHLKIVKTSEDGKVSGLPFHVSGSGVEKDVSTGSDGTVQTNNLPAGTYTCLLYTSGAGSVVFRFFAEQCESPVPASRYPLA